MSIGNKSIEQHLLMADIRQPFYIKKLLSKQDWTIFEEQHSTKGTRAYQPKVMVRAWGAMEQLWEAIHNCSYG